MARRDTTPENESNPHNYFAETLTGYEWKAL